VAAAALLIAVTAVCAAGSEGDEDGAVDGLPRVDFTFFAPEVHAMVASETTVWQGDPVYVATDYDSVSRLVQMAAPAGDLCRALAPQRLAGDTCEVSPEGVVVTSMEEQSGLGLVREGTLLYWSSLVTEADAGLLDRAETSLREAPEAEDADLGPVSTQTPPATAAATQTASEPEPPTTERPLAPRDFDPRLARRTVRHLAGDIGPREATGRSFRAAAGWVAERLESWGYPVGRQPVDVPGGVSWGVPVHPGRSQNVIAEPAGFAPATPHLVVGAHLDTVPQAPGAEDNASGVGVLLASARAAAERRTRLPVVFVAFGAEEPRGPGDDAHHFGSRAYVAAMTPDQRRAVRGMISLDRVGVGARVPVGSAGDGDPVQRGLLAAARRAGVPTVAETDQRSSDHWSFVREGLPGARLGSTPYAGYHSATDLPGVVQPAQLERTGRLVLAWLGGAQP